MIYEFPPEPSGKPVPPVPPEDSECCRSGCDPCVFDLYAAAVERYRAALKEWEEKQAQPPAPAP